MFDVESGNLFKEYWECRYRLKYLIILGKVGIIKLVKYVIKYIVWKVFKWLLNCKIVFFLIKYWYWKKFILISDDI